MTEFPPWNVLRESLNGKFTKHCPICRMPAFIGSPNLSGQAPHYTPIICARCGPFRVEYHFASPDNWQGLSGLQIANISGYLRENQGWIIASRKDIDFLRNLSTPPVAEKAIKLLRALASLHPIPGTNINSYVANAEKLHDEFISKPLQEVWPIDKEQEALSIFPMLGFAWAGNAAELRFLLFDYLWREMEFLSNQDRFEEPWIVRISPAGWEHLQKFGISNSNSGFVALWFDPTMDAPWQNGFLPAITEAGYSPVRIDKTEHNNKIDDEIIATIRGARFLVADFTGSRGGVYFEAGFAAGLGKPVIWTVREDYLDQLHFDTRQYNHISWHPNDLETFKASLRNRIEATLGRGTLRPQ